VKGIENMGIFKGWAEETRERVPLNFSKKK